MRIRDCWSKGVHGPVGSYFEETVRVSFRLALAEMGPLVQEAIGDMLGALGISERETGARFEEIARVLTEKVPGIGQTLVYKTLVGVCEEYSFPASFSQNDPLRERFAFLQDRVLTDHMTPRYAQRATREGHFVAPSYLSILDSFKIAHQDPRLKQTQ